MEMEMKKMTIMELKIYKQKKTTLQHLPKAKSDEPPSQAVLGLTQKTQTTPQKKIIGPNCKYLNP